MLQPWLRKMHRLPAQTRQQVALWSAGTITGVIALIWLTSVPQIFEETASEADPEGSAPMFSTLVETITSQVAQVREAIPTSSIAMGEELDAAMAVATSSQATTTSFAAAATTSAVAGVATTSHMEPTNVPTPRSIRIQAVPTATTSQLDAGPETE
jgi:hypothetical protein